MAENMASLMDESDGSSARTRLESLMVEIGALNDKKRGWQEAWEIEVKRTNDHELEKPPELRALNKQLGPLYGEKEDILRRFPHLEAEYGGKKRQKSGQSPLGVSRSVDKAERKAKKKANHEKNLARRREEDRARARGGTGGGGKKKNN